MIIPRISFLLFLFILPFLSAGTSPQAQMILFFVPVFLITVFLMESEPGKKRQGKLDLFFVIWLFFLFFAFLSVIFSISLVRSIPVFFNFLAVFVLAALSRFIFASEKSIHWLCWTILSVGFFLCIWSAYYFIPGVRPPEGGFSLVYALYGHNNLSDYLLFCLPLSLILVIKEKRRKLIFLTLFIVYFISFIATLARGAWLIFLTLPILLYITDKSIFRAFKTKILVFFPALICGLCLAVLFFIGMRLVFDKQNITRKDWLGRQFIKALNWEKRPEYWSQSLEIFKNHPLTGSGLNTFYYGSIRYQRNPQNYSSFSHNYFLQLLSETGIFGFVSFAILMGYLLIKGWLVIKDYKNPYIWGLWLAGSLSILHCLIDYDWNQPAIFLTTMVILTVVASFNPDKKTGLSRKKGIFLFVICLALLLFSLTYLVGVIFYSQAKRSDGEYRIPAVKKYYRNITFFYPWNLDITKEIIIFGFENDKNFAQKEINHYLSIDGQNPELYQFLAEQYRKVGETDRAKEYLKISLYYHPLQLENWLELMSFEKTVEGKKLIFREIMEKVKDVNNFDIYHRAMGKIYWQMSQVMEKEGDIDEAINYGEQAITIDTWIPEYYLRLKDLYLQQNDLDGAWDTIQKCRKYFAPDKRCISAQEELSRLRKR